MSANSQNMVSIGLYRHFKGEYYYVTSLSKSATDEKTILVNYFNVCHPEFGSFSRPMSDFFNAHDNVACVDIKDRIDNVTGQMRRFERVKDLNFQISSVSTEQLIQELRRRTDSPIHELDIEGLESKVFCRDYIIGEACEETDKTPRGVYTLSTHESANKALCSLVSHPHKRNARVFKRTFIEVE